MFVVHREQAKSLPPGNRPPDGLLGETQQFGQFVKSRRNFLSGKPRFEQKRQIDLQVAFREKGKLFQESFGNVAAFGFGVGEHSVWWLIVLASDLMFFCFRVNLFANLVEQLSE